MAEYTVQCPKRDEATVQLEICVGICEDSATCEQLAQAPPEEVQAAERRFAGIPEPTLEVDGTMEVIDNEEPLLPAVADKRAKANEALQRALAIKGSIEDEYWEMGKVLHEIYTNTYYVDYGYSNWKEFCETELEIQWRTATYLKDIYVTFTDLAVTPEDRRGIGWAKMKELLKIVNKANMRYWLTEARKKDMTVAMLHAQVMVAEGKMSEEEAKKLPKALAFKVYEEQAFNIERTLEIAARLTGSASRTYNLEMICAEFRATYEAAESDMSKLRIFGNVLMRMEQVLGVRFTGEWADVSTGEVATKSK